ncbi:MAG: alkaline phosphatase family protein, partial [Gemmatimonadaceae bacterium]
SVTGPGYVPFLTGRFPAPVGIPGLRWFDRARQVGLWPAYSRSYAGVDIWHLDNDLLPSAQTLFELARPSLSAMSMLGRGAQKNIGRSIPFMIRVAPTHFRGDLDSWVAVEKLSWQNFMRRFEKTRHRFATLAATSPDKRAHKDGPFSNSVRSAIRDINDAIATAQAIAERGGWRDLLDIWVVGDHGHAPVAHHEDLHAWLEARGLKVRAHPSVFSRQVDVALMVGGNAMAHIYLDPAQRTRTWWGSLAPRWQSLHDDLLKRDAVDLLAIALEPNRVRVSNRDRGSADIVQHGPGTSATWDYLPVTGDPLQLGGAHSALEYNAAHAVCASTEYPDSLVQLTSLLTAPRSGDIVVSAAHNWDLRSRFEPVQHVSTHGALTRDQMMVPLIVSRPILGTPRRTADVMPSALELMGIPVPGGLDGVSFL